MKTIGKILLGLLAGIAGLVVIGWKLEGILLDRQYKRNRARYSYWRGRL